MPSITGGVDELGSELLELELLLELLLDDELLEDELLELVSLVNELPPPRLMKMNYSSFDHKRLTTKELTAITLIFLLSFLYNSSNENII